MDTLQILLGYIGIDISTGRIPKLFYDSGNSRDIFFSMFFDKVLSLYSDDDVYVSIIGTSYSNFNIFSNSRILSSNIYRRGFIKFYDTEIFNLLDSVINDVYNNRRLLTFLLMDLDCVDSSIHNEFFMKCEELATYDDIRIILTAVQNKPMSFIDDDVYRNYYLFSRDKDLILTSIDYWGNVVEQNLNDI